MLPKWTDEERTHRVEREGVVVAQIGARMHYAVPRILSKAGLLSKVYVDLALPSPVAGLLVKAGSALGPGSGVGMTLRRLSGRTIEAVPSSKILSFPLWGLAYTAGLRRAATAAERRQRYVDGGRAFARRIVRSGFDDAAAVYVFNSAGLEILTEARRRGIRGIVEQTIAPFSMEQRLLRVEADHYHREARRTPEPCAEAHRFADRERQEWDLADVIICASDYVRDSINEEGGAVAKCRVVPYGVGTRNDGAVPQRKSRRPLRVLTVGEVGLRKGARHVLEMARAMKGRAAFRWVGPISLESEALKELQEAVEVVGAIPRKDVAASYEWADVFLLPSLCEGSATVTYEALRAGLPVLCTKATGSIVRDGLDGYVATADGMEHLKAGLESLFEERVYSVMAASAHERWNAFGTIEAYGERLLRVIEEVLTSK